MENVNPRIEPGQAGATGRDVQEHPEVVQPNVFDGRIGVNDDSLDSFLREPGVDDSEDRRAKPHQATITGRSIELDAETQTGDTGELYQEGREGGAPAGSESGNDPDQAQQEGSQQTGSQQGGSQQSKEGESKLGESGETGGEGGTGTGNTEPDEAAAEGAQASDIEGG